MHQAKIQISLRIRVIWSESSLDAFWIAKDANFLHADNEYSNQTARIRRLIWVFVGRTWQKVRFLAVRRKYICIPKMPMHEYGVSGYTSFRKYLFKLLQQISNYVV